MDFLPQRKTKVSINLWQLNNLQYYSTINWNLYSMLPVLIIFMYNVWDLHYPQILRIAPNYLILFLYFSPFWFIHVLFVQFCQGRVFPTSSYTVFCQDKDGSGQNKYSKSWGRHKNNIQDAADGSCRKFWDVVIALKLLWINMCMYEWNKLN